LYQPFHILYGGEPLLYDNLDKLVNACNKENIPYTIITNNSDGVQKRLENLFNKVEYIQGLTSSIDPLLFDPTVKDSDRLEKSRKGYERLIKLADNNQVKDLVAEITVDATNIEFLESLVYRLTQHNISSSITFIDIKKNDNYDFSSVTDKSLMVQKTDHVRQILNRLIDQGLDVHMGKDLMDITLDSLPANYDCKFEECLHNLTIDANGFLRLCLRIGGELVKSINVVDLLTNSDINHAKFVADKKLLCEKCNWSCVMMSNLAIKQDVMNTILHSEKRNI